MCCSTWRKGTLCRVAAVAELASQHDLAAHSQLPDTAPLPSEAVLSVVIASTWRGSEALMAGLTQVEVGAILTFPAGPDNSLGSTAVADDVLVHFFLAAYPRAARPRRVPTLKENIS